MEEVSSKQNGKHDRANKRCYYLAKQHFGRDNIQITSYKQFFGIKNDQIQGISNWNVISGG
jgi:hypothetical protein